MNRSHHQAHAHVVEALSGHAPRQVPQVVYQEGHTSQINVPRRNPRSNFRDRSNRRKTTGFEEIRQEYYNLHQNKARAEPTEEVHAQVHHGQSVHDPQVHHGQSVDDPQEFYPKPSAFIKAPRRHLPPRRQRPATMEDDELVGGPGFVNRGSKAADMFARRRERTDQFVLDQENATPIPAAHQPPPQLLTQASWDASTSHHHHQPPPPTKKNPIFQSHAPAQPRRTPPPQSRPHHSPQQRPQQQQYQQQQQQYHQPQQQQHHQQHQQQQQHHYPQQHQQQQPQHQQQPKRRQQPSHGHTTVDSRRSRQPLTPKRFELNSPWNDPNMPVGNRFHPNVVPYQDSYNVSPRGWGRGESNFGEDNNIKEHYEYTDTSEKFRFTPAPRINKFGNIMTSPSTENYNSRPKSWCDLELTVSPRQRAPPPSRRAYPQQSQHHPSSVNQFTGQSSWGYGESDEL